MTKIGKIKVYSWTSSLGESLHLKYSLEIWDENFEYIVFTFLTKKNDVFIFSPSRDKESTFLDCCIYVYQSIHDKHYPFNSFEEAKEFVDIIIERAKKLSAFS